MSLKTWKQEFYSISATQAAKFSDLRAVEHSLLKWTGLKKSNLKKHNMEKSVGRLRIEDEQEELKIDSSSCALCQKYLERYDSCVGCPLYESRGGVRCDAEKGNEETNPYEYWTYYGNPYRMINALRKAKKFVEQGE